MMEDGDFSLFTSNNGGEAFISLLKTQPPTICCHFFLSWARLKLKVRVAKLVWGEGAYVQDLSSGCDGTWGLVFSPGYTHVPCWLQRWTMSALTFLNNRGGIFYPSPHHIAVRCFCWACLKIEGWDCQTCFGEKGAYVLKSFFRLWWVFSPGYIHAACWLQRWTDTQPLHYIYIYIYVSLSLSLSLSRFSSLSHTRELSGPWGIWGFQPNPNTWLSIFISSCGCMKLLKVWVAKFVLGEGVYVCLLQVVEIGILSTGYFHAACCLFKWAMSAVTLFCFCFFLFSLSPSLSLSFPKWKGYLSNPTQQIVAFFFLLFSFLDEIKELGEGGGNIMYVFQPFRSSIKVWSIFILDERLGLPNCLGKGSYALTHVLGFLSRAVI